MRGYTLISSIDNTNFYFDFQGLHWLNFKDCNHEAIIRLVFHTIDINTVLQEYYAKRALVHLLVGFMHNFLRVQRASSERKQYPYLASF